MFFVAVILLFVIIASWPKYGLIVLALFALMCFFWPSEEKRFMGWRNKRQYVFYHKDVSFYSATVVLAIVATVVLVLLYVTGVGP